MEKQILNQIKSAAQTPQLQDDVIRGLQQWLPSADQNACKEIISLIKKLIKEKNVNPEGKLAMLNIFHAGMLMYNTFYLDFAAKKILKRLVIFAKHKKESQDPDRGASLFGKLSTVNQQATIKFGIAPDQKESDYYKAYQKLKKDKVFFPPKRRQTLEANQGTSGVQQQQQQQQQQPEKVNRRATTQATREVAKQPAKVNLQSQIQTLISSSQNVSELAMQMIENSELNETLVDLIKQCESFKTQIEQFIQTAVESGYEAELEKLFFQNEQIQITLDSYNKLKKQPQGQAKPTNVLPNKQGQGNIQQKQQTQPLDTIQLQQPDNQKNPQNVLKQNPIDFQQVFNIPVNEKEENKQSFPQADFQQMQFKTQQSANIFNNEANLNQYAQGFQTGVQQPWQQNQGQDPFNFQQNSPFNFQMNQPNFQQLQPNQQNIFEANQPEFQVQKTTPLNQEFSLQQADPFANITEVKQAQKIGEMPQQQSDPFAQIFNQQDPFSNQEANAQPQFQFQTVSHNIQNEEMSDSFGKDTGFDFEFQSPTLNNQNQYQDQVKELKEQNEKLKEKLQSLLKEQENLEQMKDKNEKLKLRIQGMKIEVESKNSALISAQNQINQYRNQINEQEHQIQQISQMKNQAERAQQLQIAVKEHEQQLSQFLQEKDQLENQLKELQNKEESLKQVLKSKEQEFVNLSKKSTSQFSIEVDNPTPKNQNILQEPYMKKQPDEDMTSTPKMLSKKSIEQIQQGQDNSRQNQTNEMQFNQIERQSFQLDPYINKLDIQEQPNLSSSSQQEKFSNRHSLQQDNNVFKQAVIEEEKQIPPLQQELAPNLNFQQQQQPLNIFDQIQVKPHEEQVFQPIQQKQAANVSYGSNLQSLANTQRPMTAPPQLQRQNADNETFLNTLMYNDKGILFDNQQVTVGFQSTYKEQTAKAILYILNKSENALILKCIIEPMNSKVIIQTQACTCHKMQSKFQAREIYKKRQHSVVWEVSFCFPSQLQSNLQYSMNNKDALRIKLPILPFKFFPKQKFDSQGLLPAFEEFSSRKPVTMQMPQSVKNMLEVAKRFSLGDTLDIYKSVEIGVPNNILFVSGSLQQLKVACRIEIDKQGKYIQTEIRGSNEEIVEFTTLVLQKSFDQEPTIQLQFFSLIHKSYIYQFTATVSDKEYT